MDRGGLNVPWARVTVLHPVEAAILLCMMVAILACKRRYAIWPMIVVACFVVSSQRIVIADVFFELMRIIILTGVARVLIRQEYKGVSWNRLDLAFVCFIALRTVLIASDDPPGEFIQRAGNALDSLGMYFTARCVVRDWSDVFTTIRGFIWIGVPVFACFVFEGITHKNVFGIFGYVPDVSAQRDGRYRAQAAFADPILAGVYWAALMPLMASLFWQRRRKAKFEAILGLVLSSVIVITCASSTPIMTILFGLVATALFPFRGGMRLIRWGLLVGFIVFQCLSDKPAWRLFVDIDIVGGSTGYYRYKLIDEAVKHVGEWWLMGGHIDTTHWSSELKDDTNHFLVVGLEGGIPLLLVFLIVIALAFGSVGRAWRAAGKNRPIVIAAWALGVSLLMHIMSFFSVVYFGQCVMLWDLTLAMCASMRPTAKAKKSLPRDMTPRRRRSSPPTTHGAVPVPSAISYRSNYR